MNKTVSFVSLFRGEKGWNASVKIDGRDVGATHLPKFDISAFEPKVSKDGKTRYLCSKRPMLVEYSDIRPGKKPGKFFTNLVSIALPEEIGADELDGLLEGDVAGVEPAKDEPAKVEDNEF